MDQVAFLASPLPLVERYSVVVDPRVINMQLEDSNTIRLDPTIEAITYTQEADITIKG